MNRGAVVAGRSDVQVDRVLVGVRTPSRGGDDQVPDGIDVTSPTGRTTQVRQGLVEDEQRITDLRLARPVPPERRSPCTGDRSAPATSAAVRRSRPRTSL